MGRRRRHNFNVYRDGKIHVCAKLCETCIFKPDSPLRQTPIIDQAVKDNTAVVCHATLDTPNQSVCRGFYENHHTLPLVLARAMGNIEFDDIYAKTNP